MSRLARPLGVRRVAGVGLLEEHHAGEAVALALAGLVDEQLLAGRALGDVGQRVAGALHQRLPVAARPRRAHGVNCNRQHMEKLSLD